VRDRRKGLKKYKRCFVASEAIDFLVESGICSTRSKAVELGQILQGSKNLIGHVTDDRLFEDKRSLFRFTQRAGSYQNRRVLEEGAVAALELYGIKDDFDDDDDESGEDNEGMSFRMQTSTRFEMKSVSSANSSSRRSIILEATKKELHELERVKEINERLVDQAGIINEPFLTDIKPTEMRCLALVAHNHMKPAMKMFIEGHSEILKKFRLTGTNTTMTMCETVFGEDNDQISYGPKCTSGPLGGDAQLAALLCLEDVGAIIFFMDPLSPHPHQADIDSLVRLTNVHNIILCPNPTTAVAMMWMLRHSLENNKPEMFPSFFETLESPAVADYKAGQKKALDNVVSSTTEHQL